MANCPYAYWDERDSTHTSALRNAGNSSDKQSCKPNLIPRLRSTRSTPGGQRLATFLHSNYSSSFNSHCVFHLTPLSSSYVHSLFSSSLASRMFSLLITLFFSSTSLSWSFAVRHTPRCVPSKLHLLRALPQLTLLVFYQVMSPGCYHKSQHTPWTLEINPKPSFSLETTNSQSGRNPSRAISV